jgi:phosphatidylglycerol:prolipoprotein diacylglycerol transferase
VHPVLLHVGEFPIYSYGAFGAVAFVVGCAVVLTRARAAGMDLNRVADVIFWMSIVSLAGARLTYLALNPDTLTSFASVFDVRGGGLVFYGSFLFGVPAGFALMRAYGLPAFAVWDLFGAAFPLAHAVARLGCFASGCCYGSPSAGPLAVTFPPDSPIAPPGVPLHPVQLYEAGGLLVIAVVTNLFYDLTHPRGGRAARRASWDGEVFLLYVILYAALRPVTEVFRGDLTRGWFLEAVLGPVVSFSQGFSLVFVLGGILLFAWAARRANRLQASSPR